MSYLEHIYLTGKPYIGRGNGTFAYPADSWCSESEKQEIYLCPSISAAVAVPVSKNLEWPTSRTTQPWVKAYQYLAYEYLQGIWKLI